MAMIRLPPAIAAPLMAASRRRRSRSRRRSRPAARDGVDDGADAGGHAASDQRCAIERHVSCGSRRSAPTTRICSANDERCERPIGPSALVSRGAVATLARVGLRQIDMWPPRQSLQRRRRRKAGDDVVARPSPFALPSRLPTIRRSRAPDDRHRAGTCPRRSAGRSGRRRRRPCGSNLVGPALSIEMSLIVSGLPIREHRRLHGRLRRCRRF